MDVSLPVVLIVASGNTEFEALPPLLRDSLNDIGRRVDVRFPPNHRRLDAPMAARLVKAGYWSLYPRPPKAVVLVDCDSVAPLEVAAQMRERVAPLLTDLTTRGLQVLVAVAKWHLEAWFFGDPDRLRATLGRDLGQIVLADPDSIDNPKQHLINLLGTTDRIYSARVAADIARSVEPSVVAVASSSFAEFEMAVRNGAH